MRELDVSVLDCVAGGDPGLVIWPPPTYPSFPSPPWDGGPAPTPTPPDDYGVVNP